MTRTRGSRRRAVDWDAIRGRLKRALDALGDDAAQSPEQAARTLHDRAERLARRPERHDAVAPGQRMLVFRLDGERYALDLRYVRTATVPGPITPVPGTPDLLLGVTCLRGEVVAVFDLRRVLDARATTPTAGRTLLLLGERHAEFAVLASEVEGFMDLNESQLRRPSTATPADPARRLVLGITDPALVVLDAAALLADERLFLDMGPAAPMRTESDR